LQAAATWPARTTKIAEILRGLFIGRVGQYRFIPSEKPRSIKLGDRGADAARYSRLAIIKSREAVHQQDVHGGSSLGEITDPPREEERAITCHAARSIAARYREHAHAFDLLGEQIQMTNIHESPQLFCPHGFISGAAEPGDANFRACACARAEQD